VFPLRLVTDAGELRARLHLCPGDTAVLWVFGSGGGLGGPAGGLYDRLGEQLRPDGVASLELDYRRPGRLPDCIADVLSGIAYLKSLGKDRIVLVGHSFGGAVVIGAAARSPEVIAVAAMSSQSAGTGEVGELSPRPVLFVHGEADEILTSRCSHDLYARAREPKQLILYPGCRHGLDQCREALDRDLAAWLRRVALGEG
jgi:alpha-beta hydrolase superfamily lysophospholipase